ncbi:MAG: DUF6542 domain-containing protein [Mycobacteriaceae bacterium]|uniref:DUF6542 domain-containing protein n=1 Tax=Corynebacterium sp. TaxID=1720 RepID=UPI003F9E3063
MTSDSTSPADPPLNRRGLIPVWAPLLVMVAVFLTGVVLGEAGTSYAVLFAVAAVICTALVELRGLFLTVVLLPFYWFFGVTGVGVIADSDGMSGTDRRTALIRAAYPAIEAFLWLAATFVICLVIAVVRYRIDVAVLERQRRRERAQRQRMTEAETENQRLNSRVRGAGGSGAAAASRTARPGQTEPAAEPDSPSDRPRSEPPRTRTAAELREASERRRRSRGQGDPDSPLDLD